MLSARRITAVRVFARYLSGIDPATEIPPLGQMPERQRRHPPFLFSGTDISAVAAAASRLAQPLRAATYRTLIGLPIGRDATDHSGPGPGERRVGCVARDCVAAQMARSLSWSSDAVPGSAV